jgi:hypothetical protein
MKRLAILTFVLLLPTIAEARWRRGYVQQTQAQPTVVASPTQATVPAPAQAASPIPVAAPSTAVVATSAVAGPATVQAAVAAEPAKPVVSDADGLLSASKAFPGAHCCEGQQHPLLMALAIEQATRQANLRQQGHQGFDARFQRVAQTLGMGAAEIAAESWPEQRNAYAYDLGMEMFKCWSQSPGHWSVASKPHKYWGGAIRQGCNGIWYATILVAD